MDRLELKLMGVDVPPLGSEEDYCLRAAISARRREKIAFARFIGQAILTEPTSRESMAAVNAALTEFENIAANRQGIIENKEKLMRAEYEKYRNLRPVISLEDPDGNFFTVRGLQ